MSKRNKGVKYLCVVESPSKIGTISKILGKDYVVEASFGHIMDLPKSRLGVAPDNNFEPEYHIVDNKKKVVRNLKSHIGPDTIVYLASDDDREGNVISWTIMRALNIKKERFRRVVFHEITPKAILKAFENPVELDMGSVHAGIARRVLDRIIGYKLSPLLWTKIKYGLSSGRTQSVALRLMVEKEKEIKAFIPEEFWKLKLDVLDNPPFKAEFAKKDGKKYEIKDTATANTIYHECKSNPYVLDNVIENNSVRNPVPPFTTSTLQQAASSNIGFPVKLTMDVAQKLYESGKITYMRTDSKTISNDAIASIKKTISSLYGNEYLHNVTRTYKNKGNAQEAHECIRPTDMSNTPDSLKSRLNDREYKLYKLIWSRTMATQMTPAKVATTTFEIGAGKDKRYTYISKGVKILFKGFLIAYDTSDKDEKILPNIPVKTVFKNTNLVKEKNFTKPPARYNEAGLVKKLEAEGIGRPSTYATTISTNITRGYVETNKDKRLEPTLLGITVSDFLTKNFGNVINVKFTANIEEQFDLVASNKADWRDVIGGFYKEFIKTVEEHQDVDRVQYSKYKELGKDPETGESIYVHEGQYGVYITIGLANKKEKVRPIKTSPIPKGIKYDDVTLEMTNKYFKVPGVLGDYNGKPIKTGVGRFGPYLTYKSKFYTVREPDDIYNITLSRAIEIIKTIDDIRANNLLWKKEDTVYGDIEINRARFGSLISITGKGKIKKGSYKLPKQYNTDEKVKELTFDKVSEILSDPNNKVVFGKKRRK